MFLNAAVVAALAPPPGAHKNQRQRRRLSAEAAEIVPDACAALAALCSGSAVARAAISDGSSWPAVAAAFRQVLSRLPMFLAAHPKWLYFFPSEICFLLT